MKIGFNKTMRLIEFEKMGKERENGKPAFFENVFGVYVMDNDDNDDDDGPWVDSEHGNHVNNEGRIEHFK